MKSESIKNLTHNELKQLAQTIEKEKGDAYDQLLGTMANLTQYSERNALLIALQCPHITQVAGFCTWKKQGRCVRKGEKGIRIFVPLANRQKEADTQKQEEENQPWGFKAAYVFDITQTKLMEETKACAA